MKLVKKVAIVSEQMALQKKVSTIIRNRVDFDPEVFDDVDDLLSYRYLNSIHGIILAVDRFGAEHLDILLHINSEIKQIPIIMVANQISNKFRSLFGLAKADRCLLLEEKYELIDLTTVLDRLTRGETLVNREYVRYPVDVSIKILRRNGSFLTGKVLNLSLGGAQLKVPKVNFQKGESVTMDFPRHPDVKAKVSWYNRNRGLIGVQFIKTDRKSGISA